MCAFSFDPPKPESPFPVLLDALASQLVAVGNLPCYVSNVSALTVHLQDVVTDEPGPASFQGTKYNILREHTPYAILCGLMAHVIRMPRRRPSQEQIERLGMEAIRSYKRYERKRLFFFFGTIAVLFAVVVVYLLRIF